MRNAEPDYLHYGSLVTKQFERWAREGRSSTSQHRVPRTIYSALCPDFGSGASSARAPK